MPSSPVVARPFYYLRRGEMIRTSARTRAKKAASRLARPLTPSNSTHTEFRPANPLESTHTDQYQNKPPITPVVAIHTSQFFNHFPFTYICKNQFSLQVPFRNSSSPFLFPSGRLQTSFPKAARLAILWPRFRLLQLRGPNASGDSSRRQERSGSSGPGATRCRR